ncbi:MAG TPA: DUF5671 domain-containing protein [Nocardioides sp.]|nr:DUF5671 domain-containing protein [Nocardioides sp.]
MIGAVILLLLLAIVAGVAVGVRRMARPAAAATTPEGHVVRQLFQYLLLLVLLVVSAVGVAGLVEAALASGTTLAVSDTALARSVAFTVVGVPLLLALALLTRRTHAGDPAEANGLPWVVYLSAAGLVSLFVALVALHATASWALGLRPHDPLASANAVVWTAAWAVHWWLGSRLTDQRPLQPALLAGSLLGLALGLVGLGVLLAGTLDEWLGLAGASALVGRHEPILEGAVTFVLAAAVWLRYWLLAGVRSERNLLWHAYVLLAGVTVGLVVAVTAASVALDRVLVWLVGEPWSDDARRYFDAMPATIAATTVGLLTFAYHQSVLRSVEHPRRTELDRVRDYLLAGVGLAAASVGSTIVVVALVEAAADPSVVGGGAVNTLLAAVTLIGVGAPVWQLFWRRGQRAAAGADETASLTRRLYLFLLLGLTSVATVAALLAGAWILVDRILQGDDAAASVRSIRYPVGILATAAAVAAYHWAVYRSDRERHVLPARHGPAFVLLLGVADVGTAAALGRSTGAMVWAWTRRDVAPQVWSVEELAAVVAASGGSETIVLADAGELRAIPVLRRPPLLDPAASSAPGSRAPG